MRVAGSCWAIAVTDAIAAAHAILTSATTAPFLNYTQILAASSSFPYDPCGGGNPWNAFRYLSSASLSGGGLKSNVSKKGKGHGVFQYAYVYIGHRINVRVKLKTLLCKG